MNYGAQIIYRISPLPHPSMTLILMLILSMPTTLGVDLGKSILKTLKNLSLISLAAVSLSALIFQPVLAKPNPPTNLTISGDKTKPTLTWDPSAPKPQGEDWTQNTNLPDWQGRLGHQVVEFKGAMYLTGGSENKNDVWKSTNGVDWTLVTEDAGWPGRNHHQSLVYDNKLWVIGGEADDEGTQFNDVWHSTDGKTWTEATSAAAWTARKGHTVTAFQGKMWLLGGIDDSYDDKNDIWSSTDGVTWTEEVTNAAWVERSEHATAVFQSKLWISGGATGGSRGILNDVWSSPDGVNWTEEKANQFTPAPQLYGTGVAYGAGRFVMVGTNEVTGISEDGTEWIEGGAAAADNNWQSVAYGNGLFVAVSSSGTGNRVMTSPDGETWTSRTSAADNSWNDVTYSGGLFVAVASSGTGNRVM